MATETILHRLENNAKKRPNAPAYYERINGAWVPTSWKEYNNQVRQAAKSLLAMGAKKGDIVTILGFNRPEWVIMDLAIMMIGGAAAGIYTTNSPHECKYIVEHSEAPVLLVENKMQWDKINEVRQDIPSLKHIVTMKGENIDDDMTSSWEAFMEKGKDVPDSQIDEAMANLQPDQLATLIYTSGTTGPPKGVMLTHENLAATSKNSGEVLELGPEDRLLSYLPLSHIAEQMFSIHSAITFSYQLYYAQYHPQDHLNSNLKEIQPTILFGVPRIWERFHAAVSGNMSQATGIRASIANWALGVGKQVSDLKNMGKEASGALAFQHKLADRLVFSKVKEALGFSEAKYGITGAAPVSKEILDLFAALDITILEVYGQSEGSGPTTFNRPGATKFGTVGQAFPGSEVKLLDDGEIVMKGPNVFKGYYKNDAATASDLKEGWLQSGDLGAFDKDGFLTIIGRKKEIIITSGGKNIAPKNIEAALKNIPLVSQAVVIGEQRRYLTALVTLEPEAAAAFASANGISGELHTNQKMIDAIQKGIDEHVNPLFARVEQVRKFNILPRDFTVEDGELTATMKIKRRVVNDHFADAIEALYAE
ncbi:MAG: long-chain fatty acid--CoA ligase [Chloroflexota bacterium]